MAKKKLGEMLIERGLITAQQLEMGLRNQLLLGGHLGTCLLELGFVDEKGLGEVLAELHGVPYAKPEVLARVRDGVARLLSRKIVEECHAVPLGRSGKRLFVAMINPRDLAARDALAFASGCAVVPWVAPEVRIFEAMERLYDIPRRQRYVVINRSLSPLEKAAKARAAAAGEAPSACAEAEPLGDPAEGSAWGEDPYGASHRSWREVANELFPEEGARDVEDDAPPSDHANARNDATALERAAESLCEANTPDDVAVTVLDEGASVLPRVVLFSVKPEGLKLWGARGIGDGSAHRDDIFFPVTSVGILSHLAGEDHYCGPLQRDAQSLSFCSWLGIAPPREILLVPVHLNDRLVALIYGDGGPSGTIRTSPADFVRLSRMLGYALTAIIYKNKIRSIGALAKAMRV